jgi:hypothetical protein
MDTWVARWRRANRELAARAGLADLEGRAPRRSDAGPKRRTETREFGREFFDEAWDEFFLWNDVPDIRRSPGFERS